MQHPTEQQSGPLQLPEIEGATLEAVNPETVIQVQVVPVRLSNAVCTVEVNGLPASTSLDDIPPPKVSLDFSFMNNFNEVLQPDYNAPPPYEVATQATKLPTYEEVQLEKMEEGLLGVPIVNDPSQFRSPPAQRILLPLDNEAHEDVDTSLLGTDFMFYIAFFGT